MTTKERKEKAKQHYTYTQKKYSNETNKSIKDTVVYDGCKFNLKIGKIPSIEVWESTTENAIKNIQEHCCVLNFASFTRPGGGFITGAMAQEEALCHASNLYDILVSFTSIYNNNYKYSMNNGLYKDWAIWSPDVCFIYQENTRYEETIHADVITCPAPNYSCYSNNIELTDASTLNYTAALVSRCKYVLDIAEKHGVKNLILGAFGCGVFKNSSTKVATIFKDLLMSKTYNFDKVVFAIPKQSGNDNLNTFKTILNNDNNNL